MAKFKVVTPAGPTYGAKTDYSLELEALRPMGAEIIDIEAKSDDDFVAAARDADALYAKGRKITKKIIDGLERCRVISLGSVGVDSVDVAAATARGIAHANTAVLFQRHHRGDKVRSVLAGNDENAASRRIRGGQRGAALHERHQRVGGPEIDPYDFVVCHV